MIIVPSIISDPLKMTDTTNLEDLEDGEIESEGEDCSEQNQNAEKVEENVQDMQKQPFQDKEEQQEFHYSKSGKKKKSKSKGDQKFKDKSKKNRKYGNPTEDDFAGNIEKAIRKAMNKSDEGEMYPEYPNEEVEERRKHKKRKKNEGKDGPNKKRKKHEYNDEMDESEMLCIRGASPVQKPAESFDEDDKDSYASDSSHESRGPQHQRPQRHRPPQRERNKNKNERRRGGGAHPMQDPDGLCLYYMQGKCHKGDECIYSHDAQPPRKMELCKFYLMDCCAKRDKCLYMHADFPCKYYHTGLPCIYKDECKFAHGKPLTESLKNILLKHIESAPKEILGDFPRLHREGALQMIQTNQLKLMQQFSDSQENDDKNIPSLFDLNIPNPQGMSETSLQNSYDKPNKVSPKVRQSRWQNDNINSSFNANSVSQGINSNTTNVLNIKNLTGVLTPRQISDLTKMGIENLDQLGQLTVLQLNSIGISLKQITEIQLNTMSIQKLGLINTNAEQQPQPFIGTASSSSKDLDLRVPPVVPVANNVSLASDFPGKDVDMRFQPSASLPPPEEANTNMRRDLQLNKDMIDIDQYTKDALKFASKDKENIDISNETFDSEKTVLAVETKDVDHRVLPFSEDAPRIIQATDDKNVKKECDTDIRFLQPEPIFKNPEKRHRRSTTDDEDNLLIDEKWYSSDEEKHTQGTRKKSPASSPRLASMSPQTPAPHVIEPSSVLSRLGDLSKIDISEEVTKLLNTMKNNLHETKNEINSETINSPKSRDPRSRRSPDKVSELNKTAIKRSPRVSIYECVDGEPTDGRRRSDVDLRKTDYALPAFGDTDLRQGTSGDIDFRLGLPFKAIPNYTPASEINGSINSHPPIPYKLVPIDIPRPDYTDIRNSTAKSQALADPRLRKVFRLSVEESNSDSEKSSKPATPAAPRVDPRRKPNTTESILSQDSKPVSLELQTILQNSNWYKDLSSTQKIFVNQHLAPVTQLIKQYQQDKVLGKKLDLSGIQSNPVLPSIFTNLGVSFNENGEFTYLPKPKEALLKTPVNFNQNANPFAMNSNMQMNAGAMDGNNMNLMNMPPMGMGGMNNMNVGSMSGFNQSLPDPRGGPTPGLLGIAPNIPHNFNNGKFGGPNNFGGMPFNGPPGPMNDFNFMDGEQNFPRFPNRGGHRGRGNNERWNRGGGGRGHRDRKNFNDRGGGGGGHWKNDRN